MLRVLVVYTYDDHGIILSDAVYTYVISYDIHSGLIGMCALHPIVRCADVVCQLLRCVPTFAI